MDFHTLASTETSALLERLLARQSSTSLQQLQAVRESLDAAARALEVPAHADHDIQELAARLTAATEAEVRRIREEAQAALDAARGELHTLVAESDKLRAMVVQTEAEAAILKSELQTTHERAESAERDLGLTMEAHAAIEAALHKAEAEYRHTAQGRTAAEAQLNDARAAIDLMLVETEELRAKTERDAGEKVAFQQQLAQARETGDERDLFASELAQSAARVQILESELVNARETREQRNALAVELEGSTARVQTLENELVGARNRYDAIAHDLQARHERVHALEMSEASQQEHIRQLEALLNEAARTEAGLRADVTNVPKQSTAVSADQDDNETLRGEVERMVSLFDASARAVTEMASCTTSNDLLSELVKRLSLQFTRVALFRLKGNRLEGEQQVGFDDTTEMNRLVIPTGVDSMLTRAIHSGTVQSLIGDDVAIRSGTPFGGTPTAAVVLPIVLQGTTLGVVYADDSDMPESARGPAVQESSVGFARLLVGQVVVLLVRHTHELKTLAELTQYATTLLQEAREMYQADTEAGKATELVRSRLKDNIDCASQLYAYRAAMEGRTAAALFDEQILAEIEGTTPFAHDLAAVVGQMTSSNLQLTAEAS
jgi:hypothetical protein